MQEKFYNRLELHAESILTNIVLPNNILDSISSLILRGNIVCMIHSGNRRID